MSNPIVEVQPGGEGKNTVVSVKKYILDLICFERRLRENWSRKRDG
jgi:hypothetical protein